MTLCLACSPVLAAESTGTAPDYEKMFEAGEASFVSAKDVPAITGIGLGSNPEITDYHRNHFGDSEVAVKGKLLAALAVSSPVSISPAGNSAILSHGNGMAGIAVYDGEARFIYPSETRGVPDENKKLDTIFNGRGLSTLIGSEGLVWSPDGRYCVGLNFTLTVVMMNFLVDPIIIDTTTGEAFLAETFGAKPMQGNAGAVVSACFSEDSRYLYYIVVGKIGEERFSFRRYDLETGEVEPLFATSMFDLYYPHLCQTADNSFLVLQDAKRSDESMGLITLTEKKGSWSASPKYFPEKNMYWRAVRLNYSPVSDYAMTIGRSQISGAGVIDSLRFFQPGKDFTGMNDFYALKAEDCSLVPLSTEALDELMQSGTAEASPYRVILDAALSPDGEYALVVYSIPDPLSMGFCLVRLSDLACIPVSCPDAQDFQPLPGGRVPIIEWNTDAIIIHGENNLSAKTYYLQ